MRESKRILDEINEAISGYDPALKEKACDLLISVAFQGQAAGEARPVSLTGPGAPAREGRNGFATLLAEWRPRRASEKALLAAYYLEKVKAETPLTSQQINSELKDHRLSVSNITRAIDTNVKATPPLINQLRKLGTTRQARKQYAVTPEGVREVERRLGKEAG